MNLDYEEGMDVLYVASRQQNEDRLFLQWCTSMSGTSFEEFKQKTGWNRIFGNERHTEENSHEETEEDILAQVADILG